MLALKKRKEKEEPSLFSPAPGEENLTTRYRDGNGSLLSLFGGGSRERGRESKSKFRRKLRRARGVEIDRGGNYGFFSSNPVSPLALSGILRVNIGPERDNNRIRKGHGWKLESDARIRQQGPLYLGSPQLDRVADDYKTNKRRKTELVNLWLGIMVPGYS